MPKAKTKPAYAKADMKAVSDNPEWTGRDFAKAKPFSEVFPEIAKTISHRGPQKRPTKIPVNIRLSPAVVKYFSGHMADYAFGSSALRAERLPSCSLVCSWPRAKLLIFKRERVNFR
jgi:uncharacterized protein (DUF4415 family)